MSTGQNIRIGHACILQFLFVYIRVIITQNGNNESQCGCHAAISLPVLFVVADTKVH